MKTFNFIIITKPSVWSWRINQGSLCLLMGMKKL